MKVRDRSDAIVPGGIPGRRRAAAVGLTVAGMLLAGWASAQLTAGRSDSSGSPPWVITNPTCILLTNVDGFIAHIVVTENTAGKRSSPGLSGELFCRQAQLHFVPDRSHSHSRRGNQDWLSFIWDVTQNRGFALSESLQGYAPIASLAWPTNVAVSEMDARKPPTDKMKGQRCVPEEVTIVSSDGTTNRFQTWRAPGLKNIRLEVVAPAGATSFILRLSKVRLEPPPPEVFVPPGGFTAYPSLAAMQNELAQREQALRHNPESEHHPSRPNLYEQPSRRPGSALGE